MRSRGLVLILSGAVVAAACWGCGARTNVDAPETSMEETASPSAKTSVSAEITGEAEPVNDSVNATLTIVYDNDAPVREDAPDGLQTAWGFACFIETDQAVILFNTGGDGERLLGNMEALGIDPARIDIIVLSHEHSDHTGGLSALPERCTPQVVYVPAGFSSGFKSKLAEEFTMVEVDGPCEITPQVRSTGQLGSAIIEQGLLIDTDAGTILVTGCAHPGIAEMAESVEAPDGLEIIIGGFHLKDAGTSTIDAVVARLSELGVHCVAPTHCTGEAAKAAFSSAFGDRYIDVGLGSVYTTAE